MAEVLFATIRMVCVSVCFSHLPSIYRGSRLDWLKKREDMMAIFVIVCSESKDHPTIKTKETYIVYFTLSIAISSLHSDTSAYLLFLFVTSELEEPQERRTSNLLCDCLN